ncbi:MAG: calcium-binding protein [Pseudomonadota bacterium]
MAITIDLTADGSGNGVDLQAFLDDFDNNFSSGSGNYGSFFGGASPTELGNQFWLEDQNSSSSYTGAFLATTGSGMFEYNMSNHTVAGNLDQISFGSALGYDADTSLFEFTDSQVDISGLNLGDSATNSVLAELRTGDISTLESTFASQGVAINGSSGADVIGGWAGDDALTGNAGDDVFFFDTSANFGDDTVTDFTTGEDLLDIDYNSVTIGDDGNGNALITHINGTITLTGVDFNSLDQTDFV